MNAPKETQQHSGSGLPAPPCSASDSTGSEERFKRVDRPASSPSELDWPDTDAHQLQEWVQTYPRLSTWLADMECPNVFRQWAKTSRCESWFRHVLDRWLTSGRPELGWPEGDYSWLGIRDRVFQQNVKSSQTDVSSLELIES